MRVSDHNTNTKKQKKKKTTTIGKAAAMKTPMTKTPQIKGFPMGFKKADEGSGEGSASSGYGVNVASGTDQDPFKAASDNDIFDPSFMASSGAPSMAYSESIERSDSDYDGYLSEVSEDSELSGFSFYNVSLEPKKQKCIDTLLHCAQSCTQLISYCLKIGDEHADQKHISMLSVCSDVCNLAAKAMSLESEFEEVICELAAEVCERCAADCREINENDERIQDCADTCQDCADACSQIIML